MADNRPLGVFTIETQRKNVRGSRCREFALLRFYPCGDAPRELVRVLGHVPADAVPPYPPQFWREVVKELEAEGMARAEQRVLMLKIGGAAEVDAALNPPPTPSDLPRYSSPDGHT